MPNDAPGRYDELPAGCLVLDARDRIRVANATIAEWLGEPRESLLGRPFAELLTAGGRLYFASTHQLREQLTGDAEEVSYELRRRDRAEPVPVFVTTRRLDPERRLYLVYRADVRRRYEAQLLEAKKEAEASSRARQTFLQVVTHEVRTPIHAVLGVADLLGDTALSSEQARLLEVLQDSGRHLLGLVNDVLDLSRAEHGRLVLRSRPTSLHQLLDAVLASLRPTVSSPDLELVERVDPACPPWVLLDAGKVRQVLTNLISNAIRFTPAGHVLVRIGCEAAEGDHPGHVRLTFAVEDTGVGIPDGQLAGIFEAFAQVSGRDNAGGTGLGLAISRRLVAAMGGELTVSSQEGVGTRFAFTLAVRAAEAPRDETPALQVTEGKPEARTPQLDGTRVLVADENATNRLLARRYLRATGAHVAEAADGEEAVALATEQTYDFVLMDLRMPRLDGYAAAERLRGLPHHARTPIIAATASGGPDEVAGVPDAGGPFDERMVKPFTARELVATVARHVGGNPRASTTANAGSEARPLVAAGRPDDASTAAVQLDLDELAADFKDDPEDRAELAELIGIMVENLERARSSVTRAAESGEVETVAAFRHKVNSQLQLLRPEPLRTLLQRAVDADYRGDRAALARELDQALTATAEALRRHRAGLAAG